MLKRALILVGTMLFGAGGLLGLMWFMSLPMPSAYAVVDCIHIDRDVTASEIWTESCYRVMTATVTIQPGAVLTISPPLSGTRVEFEDGAQLQVLGKLQALGAGDRPVSFTSIHTDTARSCAWLGIILEDDGGGDRIQHALIEYACVGIKINDEDRVAVVSNTFRFNGDGGSRDGAIGGDTDDSLIRNNVIYSSNHGIILGESFGNEIVSNTIHHIEKHAIVLVKEVGPGGDDNLIANNTIHHSGRNGIRLEDGNQNIISGNVIFLNADAGIYLSEQDRAQVRYNHVYNNGNGSSYRSAIYITGSDDEMAGYPDVAYNVVYDERGDAIEYSASNNSPSPSMTLNALCSIPANDFELHNQNNAIISAPSNWWSTNTPRPGENYAGPAVISPWITLSLGGGGDGVVTVRLQDLYGHTVPAPPEPQTNPPAPNARRIALSSTWGTLNPTAVVVDGQGIATATLIPDGAAPPETVVLTATDFCGYAAPLTITLPNLAITKSADPPFGPPDAPINFTITYFNDSRATIPNAIITDRLPANTVYLTDTSGLRCPSCAPGADGPLTWTVPSLPPAGGDRFTLTLEYTTTTCPAILTNTVAIGSDLFEPFTDDNFSLDIYPVICDVDLVVIKDDDVGPLTSLNTVASPDEWPTVDRLLQEAREDGLQARAQHREFVYEGDVVTYTIAVVNDGSYSATNVVLTETLPEHTDYLGIGWAHVTGRTYITNVGTLSPGEGRIYYFVVQVHDPVTARVDNLVNRVCGWSDERDASPDDNCNYEDTPIRRRPLRVTKQAEACIAPGDAFDYHISYRNVTTGTIVRNVVLTDTLDPYVSYVGGPEWSCADQVCTRTLPTVPPATDGSLRLPVQLSATFPYSRQTVITNVVEISGGNRFILISPVDAGPDLSVVKNDNVGPLPLAQQMRLASIAQRIPKPHLVGPLQAGQHREFVRPGELITYTILYVNEGPGKARGVVLTETLPQYAVYVGDGWTHAGGQQYTLNVGDLPPEHGGEVHFIVRVNDPFAIGKDRVVNRVDIGAQVPECDLSNNWSTDDTPVRTGLKLYVANRDSGTVDVFNTTNFEYITTAFLGDSPFGMAAYDDLLFVANFDNDLLQIISLTSNMVATSASVGHHPIHVATYDDLVYVANHSGGEGITVVDGAGNVVERVLPAQPGTYDFGFFGVTADERRGLIYATKRDFGRLGIWALTPPDKGLTLTQVVDTGGDKPSSILYDSENDRVYVTFGLIDQVWVFDPENWTRLMAISTGRQDPVDPGYGGHGLTALGQCVFVSNYRGKSVTAVISGSCAEGMGSGPSNPPDGSYWVYLPLVIKSLTAAPSVLTIPLDGKPKGLTAAGNLLFVTLPFEDRLVIINTETMRVIRSIEVVGDHPHTVILAGGNYAGSTP